MKRRLKTLFAARFLPAALLCAGLFGAACTGSLKPEPEQEIDPAQGFLFLLFLNASAGDGGTTTCNTGQFPTSTGFNTTIPTATEVRAFIAQDALCYYLLESSPAGDLVFQLSPVFGNTDLAIGKENDFGGGAPDLGAAFSCLANGWEECSIETGTRIDARTLTGTAGAYRFIGVHGLSCPGSSCEFALSVTED